MVPGEEKTENCPRAESSRATALKGIPQGHPEPLKELT